MMVNAEDLIPLNPRDYVIMLVLSRGASHGYGIIKWAEGQADGRITFDPANLYRALRRLDRDGLVEVEIQKAIDNDGDEDRRRIYKLTGLGRDVVRAESNRLAQLTDTARAWHLIPESGAGS